MILRLCFGALLAIAGLLAATPERLDRQVQAYFDQKQFNGAVLVAQDGQLLLSKGYGMANFEWNIPAGPDTKFRLGSITKQFTGLAILLLEQDGKLKTSDPVSRHFAAAPERWKPITIHHLLTHTSGIPNFTSFPDYMKTMMLASPPAESMKRVIDKPLDFDPGTKMSYSNSGYVLLGLIIENASGMSYAEFMRTRVFEPLGMKDTGYDLDTAVLPQRAAGYDRSPLGLRNAAFLDMTIPHAAGALYSTAADLLRWDAGLTAGKLLTPENYTRYFKPEQNNYAYGWGVNQRGPLAVQSHGGGINGFSTMIYRVPEKKLVVVALANVLPSQSGRVALDLLRLQLGEDVALPGSRKEIQVPVETLRSYVGEYELKPGFILTVTLEDGQLITQATGQGKLPVFAETATRFFPKVIDATLEFQKDPSGQVTSLVLEQNGAKMPAKRR
jgi:CubicO group peptidase (beta-lactamase class C family)